MQEVNEAGSVTADYVISPFKGSSRVDVVVCSSYQDHGHSIGLD